MECDFEYHRVHYESSYISKAILIIAQFRIESIANICTK